MEIALNYTLVHEHRTHSGLQLIHKINCFHDGETSYHYSSPSQHYNVIKHSETLLQLRSKGTTIILHSSKMLTKYMHWYPSVYLINVQINEMIYTV